MAILKVIIILFSLSLFAAKNDLFLQAATGMSNSTLHSNEIEDSYVGWSVETNLGYHCGDLDIILYSQIIMTEFDNVAINENNRDLRSESDYNSFSLGPAFRYQFDLKIQGWNLYVQPGYLYSISTLKFEDDIAGENQKFTFHGKGPALSLGIVQKFFNYPVFFNITWKEIKHWNINAVEIKKGGRLSEQQRDERLSHQFKEQSVSINLGIEFI